MSELSQIYAKIRGKLNPPQKPIEVNPAEVSQQNNQPQAAGQADRREPLKACSPVSRLQNVLETKDQQLTSLTNHVRSLESQLEKKDQQLLRLEKHNKSLERQVQALKDQVELKEADVVSLGQQLNDLYEGAMKQRDEVKKLRDALGKILCKYGENCTFNKTNECRYSHKPR